MLTQNIRTRGRSEFRKRLVFARNVVAVALFAGSLASCHQNTIWNVKLEKFSKDVHSGHISFLKSIDYSKVDLSQITRLGPHAPYYMAYVFKKLDRPQLSLRMLRLEWRRGSGLWQKQAVEQLITFYLQSRDYKQAEELAKQAFSTYPQRIFYRQLLDSWYWQHKNENVLRGLERIQTFKSPNGTPVKDRELLLFRAVSSYRLGKSGWPKLFIKLFSEQPASSFQIRAWNYFQLEKNIKPHFTATEWAFMKGKFQIAKQEFGPAVTTLQPLIRADNPLLLTPWDLRDLGRAYLGSKAPLQGAAVMKKFVAQLLANGGSSESLFAAYETMGRLYRQAKYYYHAADAFRRAIGYAPNNHDYDLVVWYLLDVEVRRSPAAAVQVVAKYAPLWHDPSYFHDVLSLLCTELIQRREWGNLWTFYHEIDGYADNRTLVRVAYDVASAIETGYIHVPNGKQVATRLLNKVIHMDADRYYTFLAAARLGKVPQVLQTQSTPVQLKSSGENTDWENLIMGFVSYGMYNEAYNTARQRTGLLGDSFIPVLARALQRNGKVLQSLRIMDQFVDRPAANLTEADLKLYYPQAFNGLIDRIAKKNNIPPPLFYGVVREESYFDPNIVSSAGAVGLTQLMPATAKDIAHRMGMKDPVISNPADNLAIGAHYLSTLISQFHDTGEALFAYNAGFTRVYRWKAQYPDLPDDLFLEAVPFAQTQGYVKKILVSAVAYGYLYYGMTPQQIIKEILPHF